MKTGREGMGAKIVIAGLWACVALGWGGCETSKPGVTNVVGTIEGYIDADPHQITAAAKAVAEELSLNEISANATALDGIVTAQTAREKKVKIKITSRGANVSKVAIAVGTFGDEAIGIDLFQRIEAKLADAQGP